MRYKDNFLFLRDLGYDGGETRDLGADAEGFRVDLELLTSMDITLEQEGIDIKFLHLGDLTGDCPISLADYVGGEGGGVGQVRKLLQPIAPNAQAMLLSLVPNLVKKAAV